ncbi:MAG: glycosyltransferase family 2 protein [Pseudonocardiaceae bacterium]
MPDGYGLSVIVPTHDGRERLTERLIDTYLDHQATAGLPTELIVVDSSSGVRGEALARYCSRDEVRYLRGPGPAGAKRNVGSGAAAYDALVFLDSDCMLTDQTLTEHRKIFDLADTVGAVTGPTDLYGPVDRLWKVLEHSGLYSQCFDHARAYEQVLWGVTANICVRREAINKIGGFDEKIVTPVGGEDVDFGVRLTEAGYTIRTNDQALALHAREHVTVKHVVRSLFTYGRADAYLCQVHPHRADNYLGPLAGGLLAAVGMRLLGLRLRTALAAAAATALAVSWRRQTADPYASAEGTVAPARPGGLAEVFSRAAAALIDMSFDAGKASQALRSGQLELALKNFRYIDSESFWPRKR